MTKNLVIFFVLCLFPILSFAADKPSPFNYVPPKGVIPNEDTAIEVGEAILKPIYGAKTVKEEEPFSATLSADTWTVTGHFLGGSNELGGVAVIKLSKSKGTVILISHGM